MCVCVIQSDFSIKMEDKFERKTAVTNVNAKGHIDTAGLYFLYTALYLVQCILRMETCILSSYSRLNLKRVTRF